MSRRGWTLLGVAVLAAVIALGTAWWLRTHELVDEEVDLPQIGEVTYNPLYVLGLSLRGAGWTVDMRQRLQADRHAPGPRDTVLLLNDPRRLASADVATLLAFVEGGGHLVVRTPPPEAFTPETNAPLLAALGVRPNGDSGCVSMQVEGEDPHVEFCRGQRFELEVEPLRAWQPLTEEADTVFIEHGDAQRNADADSADDAEAAEDGGRKADVPFAAGVPVHREAPSRARKTPGQDDDRDEGEFSTRFGAGLASAPDVQSASGLPLVFARLAHGDGTVDVLADLDFLTNDSIGDAPHIALTRQLLEPRHLAGTAHLLYAAEMPSLWRWLFENSWKAWAPALLALLAWLWARTARFGPLLPSPPAGRRSLMEHVDATGEHDWRYGQGGVLHRAVREAFLARLRRRDPTLAALEGDLQAELLAERFNLPSTDIRQALASPPPRDPLALRTRIATLIRLRNQL